MAQSDTHFRQLVNDLPDLVCRLDASGVLLFVNDAYADFTGYSKTDLIGRLFFEEPSGEDGDSAARLVRTIAQLRTESPVLVSERQCGDALGRIRWQEWAKKGLFDSNGLLLEVIAVGRDVTDRKMAEEQALFLASRDALTGLLNRRSILAELQRELDRTRRLGGLVGVLFADLDNFKAINDERGHAIGDRVLEEAAERFEASFRSSDLLGRLGGDEFVVVCPNLPSADILQPLLERLHCSLAEPMIGVEGLRLEVSVGWVVSDGSQTAAEVLTRADSEMYLMKLHRSGSPETAL